MSINRRIQVDGQWSNADLEFDRKTVAIPPGYIADFPPLEQMVSIYEVF